MTMTVFNFLRIQWDSMHTFLSQSVEYSRYLIHGRDCFYKRNLIFGGNCAPQHMGILIARSGVESVSLAVEVWSFNQWTAREVPRNLVFEEGMAKAWDLIMDWGPTWSSDFSGLWLRISLSRPQTGQSLLSPQGFWNLCTFCLRWCFFKDLYHFESWIFSPFLMLTKTALSFT